MNTYEANFWNLFGNSLAENTMDNNVIQMWSSRDYNLSRFYTTGFETILFNKEQLFVLETVLASTVAWDNEILIAGNCNSLEKLCKAVNKQNLTHYCLDWSSDSWGDIENDFHTYSGVTHLLVGIDSLTSPEKIPVNKLLLLTAKYKLTLIVYCDISVTGLNDIFNGAIDYMIGRSSVEPPKSFLVARRNKLVQTEGKSRSFKMDLYTYWQWSMRDWTSIIEPMRI